MTVHLLKRVKLPLSFRFIKRGSFLNHFSSSSPSKNLGMAGLNFTTRARLMDIGALYTTKSVDTHTSSYSNINGAEYTETETSLRNHEDNGELADETSVLSLLGLEKMASIDLILEKGDTKSAMEELAGFLRESEDFREAKQIVQELMPKFLNCQALHLESSQLTIFEMFIKQNFFLADCKSNDMRNRVAQTVIYAAINHRLFNQWTDFGARFKCIIWTITKVFFQKPAEQAINHILDQVDPSYRTQACNAVLSCFRLTKTSTVFTNFSLDLLARMKQYELVPSAEAYSCVIDRLLSRVMMNSPKSPDYIETVLRIYRASLQHTALEEWVYVGILSAIVKVSSKNKSLTPEGRLLVDLREVAADMLGSGHKIPRPLAQALLHSLLPKDTKDSFLQVHVKKPLEPWGSKAILALWDSVRQSSTLPKDKCFLIISHCYPKLALQSFKARRNLKKMFLSYLAISDRSSPATYVPIASAHGLTGDVAEIEHLRTLLKDNKAYPDASLLNTIMRACLNAGDHTAALLNFHIYIEASANQKRFRPLAATKETWALATQAACKANDFVLLQRLYASLFDGEGRAPLQYLEYQSVLAGLHDTLAEPKEAPKGKEAVDAVWAIAQVEAVVKHMKDTGYSGPIGSLHQLAVKSHANYLKGIKSEELVNHAYLALIGSFNALIRDFSANLDASACPAFFKAMGIAIKLQPGLTESVVADTMDIYQYFVDSGTKIECLTYCCIINLLGSADQTQLIDKIFARFLTSCRCGGFPDHAQKTTVFNTYFRNVSVQPGKIPGLLEQMALFKAFPDDHTFLQLIRNVSQQDASLSVLYDLLYKVKECYSGPAAKANQLKFKLTPSLLGAVASAFHKAADVAEMTKALDYAINIDPSASLREKLPTSFYKNVIELALIPSENNTGEIAMLWLEKLDATKNAGHTREILDLFEKADPLTLSYLARPESSAQLKQLKDSVGAGVASSFDNSQ